MCVARPCVAKSDLETSGDILHIALPAAALASTLVIEDDYQGVWQLAKAGVSSRLVVEALKAGVDKQRPDGSGDDSFPSGHTADSFAAATYINQRYGWEYGVPSYLVASYVAYTRVASDKHHVEDVLAGAAIGILAGWYFTDPYEDISIIPIAYDGTYGVFISGRF
ncbi:phosphatase PAP2 family protein [Shewanella gaetbuli]|uniref:undecaprenyl-diphosphate phosphatase n=2 Tax=Shewanella gaetbuli TaxID=220752 RepID=A0A9X1ZNU0_9GAMM|nr:phosphatase PAP2 family protein [Shewanella gaetbuli]MCL1141328.1 phosphatase PAP2 family protein [Shewanella gaetbuli]